MLLLYILWDDWPDFYDFSFKWTATTGIGIHPTEADSHSWWISKMQSGRKDILEERYAIKFCFKLEKMPQKRIDCFWLLLEHLAWIEDQFLSGMKKFKEGRESLRDDGRCGRGTPESIHQSWLTKGLGLGFRLLCWGFKGVQEEIPSEEASTLQTGSVAFPAGQCTSPQLHTCHRLFDKNGYQDSSSAYL